MPELISKYQSGGVVGRQINEGILVANELIGSRFKSSSQGIVYKLHFKKAFDMVIWNFMDALLGKFWFGIR